jgi:putative peptidoglycan lipid II flippase
MPGRGGRGGLGARAIVVSAATMLSRVLGLVRDQVFGHLFGATLFADAYVVAFRIPNLLRDLFAEGALSAAFVPTFAERLRRDGAGAAFRLANVVIGAVLVVVGGLCLVGVAVAPWVVHLLADDFAAVPGKFELTVLLTRVMFPFLPLVSLAAVAMGALNAQERYGAPALATALFNVVAIAAGLALSLAGVDPRTAVVGWACATVLGGCAQVAIQLPPLFRTGFRLRPELAFRDPGLRRIAGLMGPATVGLAATQLNIFVNTSFASSAPGAVSWLSYAFRLIQLPIGVFGVAVATVATTRLARHAADGDAAGLSETFARGLRLVAFLTVPSTIGLAVLAEPIVRLLFEHGAFDAVDTTATAAAVVTYSLGLAAYAAVKVAAPAFYAVGRSRVPLLASVCAVAGNLLLNWLLFPKLGHAGLALGTSLAATLNFAVLAVVFRRTVGRFDAEGLARHLVRVVVASAGSGAAAWAAHMGLARAVGTETTAARAAAVLGAVAAGVVVYLLAARRFRLPELDELTSLVRRRS